MRSTAPGSAKPSVDADKCRMISATGFRSRRMPCATSAMWTSRSRLRQFFDDKMAAAAAAAAETGMPAMPSKASALKRLGKRKHQQPEPLK